MPCRAKSGSEPPSCRQRGPASSWHPRELPACCQALPASRAQSSTNIPLSQTLQDPPFSQPKPDFYLFIFFYKQRVTKGQRIKFERGSCSSTNTQQTQAPIVHTSISSHELLNSLPGW